MPTIYLLYQKAKEIGEIPFKLGLTHAQESDPNHCQRKAYDQIDLQAQCYFFLFAKLLLRGLKKAAVGVKNPGSFQSKQPTQSKFKTKDRILAKLTSRWH